VLCHEGNLWVKDCMEVVYKNQNVFTNISGLVLGYFSEKFERFIKTEIGK
jgi:predicted TIM-barrel fold metal-dependent hydrolase